MSATTVVQHNATNGRLKAKHQHRQQTAAAAIAAADGGSSSALSSSSLPSFPAPPAAAADASQPSVLPSRLLSLLPSLLSVPLSSLTFALLQNAAVTSGCIPDAVMRSLSRHLLQQRYDECHAMDVEALTAYKSSFVAQLSSQPVAIDTAKANSQHYEVPVAFYSAVLGPRLKYSCGYFPTMRDSLDAGEDAMLSLYLDRAQLSAGQRVLDLGCGWGSFTLFAASRFPTSHFIAVSNSSSQREYITARAQQLKLSNVTAVTCDINELSLMTLLPFCKLTAAESRQYESLLSSSSADITEALSASLGFERVVSIEMFEHMRNYHRLLSLCSSLLRTDGLLFAHLFCHRFFPYHFLPDSGWMAQFFFSGGTMPSADLLLLCLSQSALVLDRQWSVSGLHYARTSRLWLQRLDSSWRELTPLMQSLYSAAAGGVTGIGMMRMWRTFFIAVEELFAWKRGDEWHVQHFLLRKRS